jgi:hypothetical protein
MQKVIQLEKHFNKVRCKGLGALILTQGDQPALVVEADEELLSNLIAEVRGDSLVLGLEEDWFTQLGKIFSSIFSKADHKITYYLTVTDLNHINISGKIDLNCNSLITDNLNLKISGLGNLNFDHLECKTLDVRISGRGEFSASGHVDHQSIRISGSGKYKAPQLACTSAEIIISGQGDATLRVEESLDITISGMGEVNYYGQPKIRQTITGMGKSKRLND